MPVAWDDSQVRADPRYGWLAALIPQDARRFRVDDGDVRTVVTEAGGELVDRDPDVEIARHPRITGGADIAVILLDRVDPRSSLPRALRAARRVRSSVALHAVVRSVRRAARARGYPDVRVLPWERGAVLRRAPLRGSRGAGLKDRLPVAAAVVASRGVQRPSVLDGAADAAERATGSRIDPGSLVLGSSGVVLGAAGPGILRASLGPPGRRIHEQAAALHVLEDARPEDVVAARVPWVRACGTEGLARWSLERGLEGAPAAPGLAPPILDQCVEFLGALHRVTTDADLRTGSVVGDAEIVAAACEAETATRLGEIASEAERRLADVPRGFAHGDFWSGNLLVDGDNLRGVVDWPSAGPGRLPLLDLLHLELNAIREGSRAQLGEIVRDRLLPAARAGGTPLDVAYLRRVDLDLAPTDLEALVVAYWLEELAHDLADVDRDPRKVESPVWWQRNVSVVLEVVERRRGSTRTRA